MRTAVFVFFSLLLCTIAGSQPLPPSHPGAIPSIAPSSTAAHPGSPLSATTTSSSTSILTGATVGNQTDPNTGIPVVSLYGMTIGEYARMLIGEQWLDPSLTMALTEIHAINQSAARIDSLIGILDKRKVSIHPSPASIHPSPVNIHLNDFRLVVIPCRNYTHKSRYTLPVKPSPNLPDMQSVYLYPSLCLFEGTPISIGRGTSKSFQQFGHPSFPAGGYSFTPESTPGARNPPRLGQVCNGYDLSEVNVAKETGNRWSLKWLLKAYALFPDKGHFFTGTGSTFDRLAGTAILAQQIREGLTEEEIRKTWEPALSHFKTIRKKYLLYAD
jgi:hypothetical protein